jgi:O-antigen ligase
MLKRFFVNSIILSSAFVDVPGHISAGVVSLSGIITILVAVGVTVTLVGQAKRACEGLLQVWPLSCLVLYSILQCFWHRPSIQGLQNISVLWSFVGLTVLVCMDQSGVMSESRLRRMLIWAAAIAATFYTASLSYGGIGTDSFIGARSFGLYALLGLGFLLGDWREDSRASLWLALCLALLIALSLSRAALAVGALLFPLARMRSFSFAEIRRVFLVGVIVASGFFVIVTSTGALGSRFLGDYSVTEFFSGDASLDASGRVAIWAVSWNSLWDSPWFGKGPGAANDLVDAVFEGISHPHNEYLRFAIDGGLLGLSLFLVGGIQLLIFTRRAYSRSQDTSSSGFHLGTFLALSAVLLTMITDNTASYFYVMAPLGICVGRSLSTLNVLPADTADRCSGIAVRITRSPSPAISSEARP